MICALADALWQLLAPGPAADVAAGRLVVAGLALVGVGILEFICSVAPRRTGHGATGTGGGDEARPPMAPATTADASNTT